MTQKVDKFPYYYDTSLPPTILPGQMNAPTTPVGQSSAGLSNSGRGRGESEDQDDHGGAAAFGGLRDSEFSMDSV